MVVVLQANITSACGDSAAKEHAPRARTDIDTDISVPRPRPDPLHFYRFH
jgi:hypothetical protein